jgi:hypothetical protein
MRSRRKYPRFRMRRTGRRRRTMLWGAGRGARELIPILTQTADSVSHLMEVQRQLGDVTSDAEGKQAMSIKKLQAEWGEAIEGIEKSVMAPFIEELSKHSAEIEAEMVKISAAVRAEVEKAWDYLNSKDGQALLQSWKTALDDLGKDLPDFDVLLKDIASSLKEIAGVLDAPKKLGDYLTGKGPSGEPSDEDLKKEVQQDPQDDELVAEFLNSLGYRTPDNKPLTRGFVQQHRDRIDQILRDKGAESPPAAAADEDQRQKDADELQSHNALDDVGDPWNFELVRRHPNQAHRLAEKYRADDAAAAAAKAAASTTNVTVHIGTVNAPAPDPTSIGKKVGDAVAQKLRDHQSQSNAQNSTGDN